MRDFNLGDVVDQITKTYDSDDIYSADPYHHFPNKAMVIEILNDIRRVMFPRYYGSEKISESNPEYFAGQLLTEVKYMLCSQLAEAFLFENEKKGVVENVSPHTTEVCDYMISRIPYIQQMLLKDVQAAFDGDPAAQSKEEVVFSYPGFTAISIYRIAHELYVKDVPLIPRIMTEYGHALTGVDINAGAKIGEYFFIDHATGVVIGETTEIGNHVKVYQGVTLGALSTRGGQRLSGKKRHPTIGDNVTIYSNASILGGETVVGAGSIIGGSAFVTESVPENSRVSVNTNSTSRSDNSEKNRWFDEYTDGAGI